VLDASIDSHIGQVMALIGKSFTRVTFRAYVAQASLPFDQPRKPEPESESEPEPTEDDHEDEIDETSAEEPAQE
jgi:hypothetical protein